MGGRQTDEVAKYIASSTRDKRHNHKPQDKYEYDIDHGGRSVVAVASGI